MQWSRSFAVLAFFAATPALAQVYPSETYYYGVISPREVMRKVSELGLQPASEPRLRGHVWVVRSIGREGALLRVVVDSHSGEVVNIRALHGRAYEGGRYSDEPRYVVREHYGASEYPPAPRAGEVYRAPIYPENDYRARGARQPYSPSQEPRFSESPEPKRLASKPPAVPLPKARPDNIQGKVKVDAAKKDDAKKDAPKAEVAKREEPKAVEPKKSEAKKDVKKDEPKQAQTPLTSPKNPETTAAMAAEHHKAAQKKPEPKKVELPPVQPLE
jgi:hypothetical protein